MAKSTKRSRSLSAKRGWETRRRNERSRAAKRGWETRRRNEKRRKLVREMNRGRLLTIDNQKEPVDNNRIFVHEILAFVGKDDDNHSLSRQNEKTGTITHVEPGETVFLYVDERRNIFYSQEEKEEREEIVISIKYQDTSFQAHFDVPASKANRKNMAKIFKEWLTEGTTPNDVKATVVQWKHKEGPWKQGGHADAQGMADRGALNGDRYIRRGKGDHKTK